MVDIEPTVMRWTFTAPARSFVIPVDAIGATHFRAGPLTFGEYDAPLLVMVSRARWFVASNPPCKICRHGTRG